MEVLAGMSFVKKTTIVGGDGTSTDYSQKFFVEGESVRTEEDAKMVEGNPGIHLYDFEKKKSFTVMKDIKLYIEESLTSPKDVLIKDQDPQVLKKYEGVKNVRVEKVRHEDTRIEGHPAAHYEIKIIQKVAKGEKEEEDRILEHYSQWVALDLGEMPLRYEFEYPNNAKKIIEYLDITSGDLDPGLFKIPEGYLQIQPF
jgi:hypothetical protein